MIGNLFLTVKRMTSDKFNGIKNLKGEGGGGVLRLARYKIKKSLLPNIKI
jgi:hypothetical protein